MSFLPTVGRCTESGVYGETVSQSVLPIGCVFPLSFTWWVGVTYVVSGFLSHEIVP